MKHLFIIADKLTTGIIIAALVIAIPVLMIVAFISDIRFRLKSMEGRQP